MSQVQVLFLGFGDAFGSGGRFQSGEDVIPGFSSSVAALLA